MKKLAAFATALVGLALLLGAPAAASSPYPPGAASLTLTPSTVASGGSLNATLSGCTTGETVNFTLAGATVSATCPATVRLTAPTAAGTYTISATGVTSGVTASATLTVRAAAAGGGVLPTTGSDSDRTLWIAGSAVIAGLGLVAVAWQRRRSTTTA